MRPATCGPLHAVICMTFSYCALEALVTCLPVYPNGSATRPGLRADEVWHSESAVKVTVNDKFNFGERR
jgi:hypothetical protein